MKQVKIKFIALTMLIFAGSLKSQVSMLYVMKSGKVVAKFNTKSDLDSIVFYNPLEDFLNSKITVVTITGGMFIMGSPSTEINRNVNETQFPVSISSFKMSQHEITNSQFADFLNSRNVNASGIDANGTYPTEPLISENKAWGITYTNSKWVAVSGYENAPIVDVTWFGADEFSRSIGGSLPTEAQWEYACRAGSTSAFNTGTCLTNIDANYNWNMPYGTCLNTNSNYLAHPSAVGSYAPNAFGLYDMHGNVSEWCSDWIGEYPTTIQVDPKGPVKGTGKVIRGGSFNEPASNARSSNRNESGYSRSTHEDVIGFRVAFSN